MLTAVAGIRQQQNVCWAGATMPAVWV